MRIKAEWETQQRVYMCYGSSREPAIKKARLPGVRNDLVKLAQVIARYEPVTVLFNEKERAEAERICTGAIEPLFMPHFGIWPRDTLGIPLWTSDQDFSWLDMKFNTWGERFEAQGYKTDHVLAELFAREHLGKTARRANFVLEGGGIDCDGSGTLMTTESCVLHKKRNKDVDRAGAEARLKAETGATHVVWLPGSTDRGDVTRGHIDGIARFVAPGVVLVDATEEKNVAALKAARQADGTPFEVIPIVGADQNLRKGKYDALTYLNFLIVNGAVILPAFGDTERDAAAAAALKSAFPDRDIVPLELPSLIGEGGGIHCSTLNI
ncbi:agmatine deiminase family protein [Aquabacter sp. L1I39]|uniref:agmatine deiminase family protein n=1 Tax=Aquabacter sp. L1I39 TaxID=2820278 RepID=UPI001ADA8509|nr:agmatine deiminase family protein [Aquabacter sp. L1I39]QTL03457.1 agmatine deiminase family protein [Aquabacter sp. L1I39]